MKVHSPITINGKYYPKGAEVPWYHIYPFFLIHMAIFGGSGFFMAYGVEPVKPSGLLAHGGLAISVYLVFYIVLFGVDQVKWMFINAGLGLYGITAEIGWILGLFDKTLGDYPWYVHIVPFSYYVLYTFLIRQALLDISGAREDEQRRKRVEQGYVWGSLGIYSLIYLL